MANVKWLGSTSAVQTVGEPVSTDSRPSFGIWPLLAAAGAAIAAYHGYKRNRGDTGAAVGWGVLGALVPIITVPVALAQGYAEPKHMLGNPRQYPYYAYAVRYVDKKTGREIRRGIYSERNPTTLINERSVFVAQAVSSKSYERARSRLLKELGPSWGEL